MASSRCCVFLVALFGLFVLNAGGKYEDDMWDRFRVWFHGMDQNYDGVLSMADIRNCTAKHAPNSSNPATVRAKCEQFLPRWLRFFVLRGRRSTRENRFIRIFRRLRRRGVDKFEDVIYQASKIFWLIMDMNNDGLISHDEDACVTSGAKNTFVMSVSFAQYLLVGRLEEDIRDPFCPWIL